MGNTNSNVANQISDINFHIFDNLQEEVVIYEIMRDMLDEIADLRVNYINSASLISEIMPSEEVIGKTVTELYDEDVAALHLKIAGKVLKSGEGKKYEVYLEPTDKYYSVSGYSPDDNMYIMIGTDISELKKAGKTLQGRKELYKEFFNNPLNGFALCEIITDDKGEPVDFVYLKVNNAFEDFTGLKREDVLNKKVTEVRPIEEIAPAIEIYGKVALTGKSEQFEITFPSLDKTYDIIAFSPQKMRFIAMFTDITEQKKIEEELKKQADLLDLTRDAIIVRDMGDRVIFWNKGAEERYGWTREEAYGKVTYNLLKTEFLDSSNRIFNQLYQKGHWEGELIQTRRDGKKIIVSSRWALQKNENNEPVGFMEINTDITEHKKADESLKESEKKFRKVFNNANDALFLHKLKENGMPGRFIEVNNVACQRLGYTRNEFLKMSPEDIDDPKEAIILPSIMKELYEKGNVTFEMVYVSKNGVKIPVEISAHIFTLNGEKVVLSIVRDITERKKTEKALKEARDNLEEQVEERTVELEEAYEALTESEEKFREIFNNAKDMITLVELDENGMPGKFIEVNEVASQRLGYSKDEFLKMTPQDIILPEEQTQKITEELQEKGNAQVEHIDMAKNGSKIPVEVNLHVFKLKGENVTLAISRDITERKEAEKAIKDSEKQLRMITDNMTDLVSQADINGIFQYVSPSHKLILGYDPEDLLGKSVYDLIHPDDLEKAEKTVRKAVVTSLPGKIEVRFRHADGHYVWLEVAGTLLFDKEHLIKGAVLGARDISNRKKAEKKLQFQADILKNVRDCVIVYDIAGKIIYWNDGAASVFGYSRKEMIGKNIRILYLDTDKDQFIPDLEEITESGEYIGEWEGKRKDGSKVAVDIRETVMRDVNGEVIGIIGVSKDITERKEAEEKLKENEEYLKTILSTIQTGMIVVDAETKEIIDANEAALRLIGVQRDEIVGHICHRFICPAEENQCPIIDLKQDIDNSERVLLNFKKEEIPVIKSVVPITLKGHRYFLESFIDIKERKEAEKALRKSEKQLRMITDSMVDMVSQVDVDGILQYVSPSHELVLGFRSRDLLGKSVYDFVHPDDLERVKEAARKAFITGKPDKIEVRFKHSDGHYVWLEIAGNTLFDENLIKGAIFGARDINERKKAEEQIKRQYSVLNGINRIFREALTSETEEEVAEVCLSVAEELTGSEIGFIGEVNANGRLEGVALSISAWKSYKAPPAEVRKLVTNMRIVSFFGRVVKEGKSQIVNNPGSDPDKVGVPEGHPAIKSFLGVPLKQGDKTTGLIALANKEGEYALEDVENVESLSIAIVEALMSFRARNKLEEYKNQLEELVNKLKESETQFRTLTENSPDLIIRVDKELKYVYTSPTVTNILGKPPEFFIGKSIEETGNPEESVELWKKDYWKVFNKGEIQYSEYEFPTVNGLKTFRRTTVPEYNDNGKIVTALSIVRDVTKRKQAEEKLKETIEELKRSNDELQRFAYVTSHDLQEPLRTIASFTQLLERRYKGKLDSDADEFMDYIVEASIRMKQMIQDLLDYSRVATKGGELKPVSSEIVLNHVLNSLRATITENNAEITHDSLLEVVADENQLTRVFLNLIANAIKFKKEDEPPKIHISSRKDEENKEYVFEVADNGIGIEEQYFDRIFTIFQRLHTRDEYQGTGIGLSIVRKIIERHEGHIWVESKPGEGSVFYFTIPYS